MTVMLRPLHDSTCEWTGHALDACRCDECVERQGIRSTLIHMLTRLDVSLNADGTVRE